MLLREMVVMSFRSIPVLTVGVAVIVVRYDISIDHGQFFHNDRNG